MQTFNAAKTTVYGVTLDKETCASDDLIITDLLVSSSCGMCRVRVKAEKDAPLTWYAKKITPGDTIEASGVYNLDPDEGYDVLASDVRIAFLGTKSAA